MKTKLYLLALIAFPFCGRVSAQDNTNGMNGYLALSGGITMPTGPYIKSSPEIPHGYALPGGNFNFSYNVTPSRFPVGLSLMAGYYYNRYDFNSYLSSHETPEVSTTFGTNDPNSMRMFYHGFYAMGGLYKEISVCKLAFDFRAMLGDLNVATPEMSFYAKEPGSPNESTWDVESNKNSAMCYDGGATIQLKSSSHLSIFLSADYTYASVPYPTVVTYTNGSNNSNTATASSNTSSGNGYITPAMPPAPSPSPMVYNATSAYVPPAKYQSSVVISPYNTPRYVSTSNLIISYVSLSVGVGFSL